MYFLSKFILIKKKLFQTVFKILIINKKKYKYIYTIYIYITLIILYIPYFIYSIPIV